MARDVPLIDLHRELGAEIHEFAGWNVPMVYKSTIEEHLAVRSSAGVFDVSHMGRLVLKGRDALELIDRLVAIDVASAEPCRMVGPTAFLNERAGFKDDVMVYKVSSDTVYIVTNAVNTEKIESWIGKWIDDLKMSAQLENITEKVVMLAVQGPKAGEMVKKALGIDISALNFLEFKTDVESSAGKLFLISRSGWTGEDGCEIWAEPGTAKNVIKSLLEAGATPAGIAARDTLRMEMGFCLYGHEIDEDANPVEARYWVFTYGKKGYVGAEALARILKQGVERVRVGLKMAKGSRIPREGCKVKIEGNEIGVVTSGSYSPVLRRPIAQAYIDAKHALIGLKVEVEIGGKAYKGKIVDFPFIKR